MYPAPPNTNRDEGDAHDQNQQHQATHDPSTPAVHHPAHATGHGAHHPGHDQQWNEENDQEGDAEGDEDRSGGIHDSPFAMGFPRCISLCRVAAAIPAASH